MKDVDDMSQEEIGIMLNSIADAFIRVMTKKRNQAVIEFEKSGLTVEEFNKRNFRDDGQIFAGIENGEMRMQSFLPLPEKVITKKLIPPERALALFQQNHSLIEICGILDRSEKWVKTSLSKFGVKFDKFGPRFKSDEIPFGWKEVDGKLKPKQSEQWLLDKIADDLRSGVTEEQICKNLNNLKIKPKSSGKWIPSMITKFLDSNRKLKRTLCTN